MGNFEKLSVLVIVVIIVMILAVAVVEWTSGPSEAQPAPETVADLGSAAGVLGGGSSGGGALPADAKPSAKPAMESRGAKPSDSGSAWVDILKQLGKGEGTKPSADEGKKPEGDAAKPEVVKPADGAKPAVQDVAETTHVVAQGETLGEIAKKYYGKSSQWTVIRDANPGVTAENIRPKQTLKIPPMKGVTLTPGISASVTDLGPAGSRPVPGKEYTVKANDTWERISLAAYNTSSRWPEIYLKNINRVRDQKDLPAGKVILIPR